MRCSICGAKLKKDGDVCNKCYEEFQEDEDLKKDVNEVFKIKRKYSIAYEILKYIEIIIIFMLVIVINSLGFNIGDLLITLAVFIVIFGFLLFWDKRIAKATSVTFYEKKVVYRFKFLFLDQTKVVKYKDLKDIAYYQTYRQKKMGLGDICFYAKGAIPGATLLNGFQIKNVENVVETAQKIKEIIGTFEN